MQPPAYFSKVEQNAGKRWAQLEADPELAGPWHQLFQQVQSPPHVLSELLQNADDAGAKRAVARIVEGEFIFEHDGEDFNAEQFASLCRFAFSNKRTLHTIGFRGVGFKSTFSLGDDVQVLTPTLAVRFNRSRFTLPVWLPEVGSGAATVVKVRVGDQHRYQELQQSLRLWATSPASLLFFRNLIQIEINGHTITKKRMADGPVANSEIVVLSHPIDSRRSLMLSRPSSAGSNREQVDRVILAQSELEPFPEEAVDEIRKERSIAETHFPPCRVEIVLGLSGQQKLYVVLPTGAILDVPFSINAPFLQDPARYGIKEPSVSPTNRWLLARAGKLAAQVMTGWVANRNLRVEERIKAYNLIPKVAEPVDNSNERISKCLREAMFNGLENEPIILKSNEELAVSGACLSLPTELHKIWNEDQLVPLFANNEKGLLHPMVSPGHITILEGHGWIERVSPDAVLEVLVAEEVSPPQPASWEQLRALWTFVANNTNRYWDARPKKVKIVPVFGETEMSDATEVVRLPGRSQLSAEDWKFVTDNAHAINASWLEWLSQQRSKKKESEEKQEDAANILLRELGLAEATPIDRIVAAASRRVFQQKSVELADCVRFAHILAALGATTPDDFQYVTRDLIRNTLSHQIVYDPRGAVENLAPADWCEKHILHDDYTCDFKSCTSQAWETWVTSGKSGLLVSLPITRKEQRFWGTFSFRDFMKDHGLDDSFGYPYASGSVDLDNWSFDSDIREHWRKVLEVKPNLYALALTNILSGPSSNWTDKLFAVAYQNGRKYRQRINCVEIPADWILIFRSLRCLKDTHGAAHMPAELLLRTPDTEVLRDIEPFVAAELDTPQNRPLLDLLNVRSTPTGTKKITERLEAVSRIPNPAQFILEIGKLYEALDRIIARCTPKELKTAVETFENKAIILGESLEWKTSDEISIFPGDDNQADSVHNQYRNLSMWPKLGVPETPSFERALEWLRKLPGGQRIEAGAISRVRSILRREPSLVWTDCQHWLSLEQTWEPVEKLRYRQTMQNLSKWEGLFPSIKQATADLRILPEMIWQQKPFAGLGNLFDVVEFEITEVRSSGKPISKSWLVTLSECLARVKLIDGAYTENVRAVAGRLKQTRWQPFSFLEITPYVDGMPAGLAITPRVLWKGIDLYIPSGVSVAKLHKELVDELSRPFADSAIANAISACIERDAGYVEEYLADQFEMEELLELKEVEEQETQHAGSADNSEGEDAKKELSGENNGEQDAQTADHEDDDRESDNDFKAENEFSDNQIREDGNEEENEKPRRKSTPAKPDLIGRYAAKQGFKWHAGEKCFAHSDGRWIARAEAPFHWVEMTAEGNPAKRLWVQEQTLTTGVDLPAELWSLFRSDPKTSILLVKNEIEVPVALTGEELNELRARKLINLYPSRYRIVQKHE